MINYPHKKNVQTPIQGQRKTNKKDIDFGRRGMSFEAQIVKANDYYLASGLAVIHKKPTPVQIVKVDFRKEQQRPSQRLISRRLQQQILMVFIKVFISILKQKRRPIKPYSPLRMFMPIK